MTSVPPDYDLFFEFARELHEDGLSLRPDDEQALWLYASIEKLLRSTGEAAAADVIHAICIRRLAAAQALNQSAVSISEDESEPEFTETTEGLGSGVTVICHYPLDDDPVCVDALLRMAGYGKVDAELAERRRS
jgi:hypothetical protein